MTEKPRLISPGLAPDRPSLPFATRLLWLVLSIIVPATLIAAGGLYSAYDAEKSATEELLLRATRTLSGQLDVEFSKLQAAIQSVARPPPDGADMATTVRRRLREHDVLGEAAFVIAPLEGPPVAVSGDLPASLNDGASRLNARLRAQQTGTPLISAHHPVAGAGPDMLIDAPLPGGDGQPLFITLKLSATVVTRFMRSGSLGGSDWNGAAMTPDGLVIGRASDEPLFSSAFAPPGLLARMRETTEDVVHLNQPGQPAITMVFSRTPNHDWYYVVTYPQHRLRAALTRSLASLGALGVVALIGLAHIFYLSRQLVRPVSRLTSAARRLARGDVIPVVHTGVTEFDDIQQALREASQQVAARNQERDQVETMLRASEQRLRLAMEASELGAWSYDPAKNELVGSERSRVLLGLPPGRVDLEALADVLLPARREEQRAALFAAIRGQAPFILEMCVQWPDGSVHWIEVRGRPVMRANGPPTVVGVVHEITERRTAADRQRVLMRELNHRVKNSLATVQSIALLTRRSAAPEHAWEAFEERLVGLAKTHDLLTASDWRGAFLADAVQAELQPYQSPDQTRITISGPRLRLHPRATLTLCMCFHELATNAAKYGALSCDGGRLSVTWRIDAEAGAEPVLRLEWAETGGPPVAPPTRQGLGSRLLDRSLRRELGGSVDMEWAAAGLRCRVALPVRAIAADV